MNQEKTQDIPFILVSALGGSPAVITELLYGLWEDAGGRREGAELVQPSSLDRAFPQQIYFITTSFGRKNESLLKEKIEDFFDIYHPEGKVAVPAVIEFKVPELDGKPIGDLKGEGRALYEQEFCNVIRLLNRDNQTKNIRRVFCDTSGLTAMSHAAIFAIQLVGLKNDKIYSVYLPKEYEGLEKGRGFYYPLPANKDGSPKTVKIIYPWKDNQGENISEYVDATNVTVELVEENFYMNDFLLKEYNWDTTSSYRDLHNLIMLGNYRDNIFITFHSVRPIERSSKDTGCRITISNYNLKNSNISNSIGNVSLTVNVEPKRYLILRVLARKTLLNRKGIDTYIGEFYPASDAKGKYSRASIIDGWLKTCGITAQCYSEMEHNRRRVFGHNSYYFEIFSAVQFKDDKSTDEEVKVELWSLLGEIDTSQKVVCLTNALDDNGAEEDIRDIYCSTKEYLKINGYSNGLLSMSNIVEKSKDTENTGIRKKLREINIGTADILGLNGPQRSLIFDDFKKIMPSNLVGRLDDSLVQTAESIIEGDKVEIFSDDIKVILEDAWGDYNADDTQSAFPSWYDYEVVRSSY